MDLENEDREVELVARDNQGGTELKLDHSAHNSRQLASFSHENPLPFLHIESCQFSPLCLQFNKRMHMR